MTVVQTYMINLVHSLYPSRVVSKIIEVFLQIEGKSKNENEPIFKRILR